MRRTQTYHDIKCKELRDYFGKRLQDWQVGHFDGGHIRVRLSDTTFDDLQAISNICDGTKNISVIHEPASATEFTPSGDFTEIVIWGPQR